MSSTPKPKLNSQLKYVYLFSFLAGLMFWYGIEQLFMEEIGDGVFIRGMTLAAFSIGMFVFNIPTGAISDVWGRVKSMRLGAIALILSLIVLSLSNGVWLYVLGAVLISLFWTFNDGALEAFVYDSLHDAKQQGKYQKIIGRVYAAELFGAGIANFLSGFIAEATSLRFTYVLSIIPAVACLACLMVLKEPVHHKQSGRKVIGQLGEALSTIRRSKVLIALVISSTSIYTAFTLVSEFTQVTVVEFVDTAVALGLIWAAFGLLLASADLFAHRLKHLYLLLSLVILGFIIFIATRSLIVSLIPLILSLSILEAITIKVDNVLQHETPSRLRATVTSVPGAMSMLAVAILSLILSGVSGSVSLPLVAIGAALLTASLLILIPLHKRIDANE